MDIDLGLEQIVEDPLSSVLEECMVLDDEHPHHEWLSVQTMFIDKEKNVEVACSEWMPEREELYHEISKRLTNLGISTTKAPDPDELGILKLTVHKSDADVDIPHWKQRRELMLYGLRQIIAAWAMHRDRVVIACTHQGQLDDDGERMRDHIHVMYQKGPYDTPSLFCSEIEAYVANGCTWERIDQSLGIFGAAEMPAFDEEYDEQEIYTEQDEEEDIVYDNEELETAGYDDYPDDMEEEGFEAYADEQFANVSMDDAFDE